MTRMDAEWTDHTDAAREILQQAFIRGMTEACMIVESQAKSTAPSPGRAGTGALRDHISHRVDVSGTSIQGIVGSPHQHAVYHEYGTGMYAESGPRQRGYWVYVKGGSGQSPRAARRYTLRRAKQIMAMMRSKGIDAYITQGIKPSKFMRTAFNSRRSRAIEAMNSAVREATGGV